MAVTVTIDNTRYSTTIEPLVCGTCAMPFGLPANFRKNREADGGHFYCPNGHPIHYYESTTQRLQRELDSAKNATAHAREQLAGERKQHAATKGQLTRTRKRAHAGVCIHCHRTFANVARHMQTKHADA